MLTPTALLAIKPEETQDTTHAVKFVVKKEMDAYWRELKTPSYPDTFTTILAFWIVMEVLLIEPKRVELRAKTKT